MITNRQRQINYLIANGFKYVEKTNTYIKDNSIGYYVVDARLMKCFYLPIKPLYMSEVTLSELWNYVSRVDDDLDHLYLNGCI